MIKLEIQESYGDFKKSFQDFKVKENIAESKKAKDFLKKLDALKKKNIYVGIPLEKTERKKKKGKEKAQMNNATLLFIHTNGSPKRNLPARPVIEPAIADKANVEVIANYFRQIAQAILEEDLSKAEELMKALGQNTVNMIHQWFDNPNNGWPPVQKETIARQLKKLGKNIVTKGERDEMIEEYQEGIKGIKTTLVDTNQMRRAITYVIGDNK